MSLQMYNTNVLSTAQQLVLCHAKFSLNAATGAVTVIEGRRLNITAGTGTGVLTITLPQIFKTVVSVQSWVVDSALAGVQLTPTTDVVPTGTKSQFTATLTKLVSGTPTAITSGTYTIGIEVAAAA